MTNVQRYFVPANSHQSITTFVNSRFITTINRVDSTAEARSFLANIRGEMPDASHHVYAFRVGYGNSVTEGVSDDGEPAGTAGPPVLAVLRGFDIGDTIIVVTRYFGGTKLGTGGLVRAYSEAARTALDTLKTEEKIPKQIVGVETPYHFYEQIKYLISKHNGRIDDETFAGEITLIITFPQEDVAVFADNLRELTAGQIQALILGDVP